MPKHSSPHHTVLSSNRALSIYILVFALSLLLDIGRFSTFLNGTGIPLLAMTGDILTKTAQASGILSLAQAENNLLHRLTPQGIIGAIYSPDLVAASLPSGQATAYPSAAAASQAAPTPATQNSPATDTLTPAAAQPGVTTSRQVTAHSISPQDITSPALTGTTQRKTRILLVGDSLMEGLGLLLQRDLRNRPDIKVIREGHHSTGLSRPDYFDWPGHLSTFIERDDPELIVICLGANDPQDIVDSNKKRHHACSASWQDIYRSRAEQLLRIATSKGSRVIWIGLPIMGKEPYAMNIRTLSDLQRQACAVFPGRVLFVDTTAILADAAGKYTTFITNAKGQHIRLRAKDMVHMTEHGEKLLIAHLQPTIDAALTAGRLPPPQVLTAEQEILTGQNRLGEITAPNQSASTGQVSPPATMPPAMRARHCSFTAMGHSGQAVNYTAYLPPEQNRPTRFPVLYLLGPCSGKTGLNQEQEGALLQLASQYQLAVIVPEADVAGGNLADTAFARLLVQEILPHAEKTFPVSSQRGLLGIADGGYPALAIGLEYPTVFASVSSLNGFGIGWEGSALVDILRQRIPTPAPAILTTTGKADPATLRHNRAVRDVLRRKQYRYVYREIPPTAAAAWWQNDLPEHMAFHAEKLGGREPQD